MRRGGVFTIDVQAAFDPCRWPETMSSACCRANGRFRAITSSDLIFGRGIEDSSRGPAIAVLADRLGQSLGACRTGAVVHSLSKVDRDRCPARNVQSRSAGRSGLGAPPSRRQRCCRTHQVGNGNLRAHGGGRLPHDSPTRVPVDRIPHLPELRTQTNALIGRFERIWRTFLPVGLAAPGFLVLAADWRVRCRERANFLQAMAAMAPIPIVNTG